MHKPLLVEIHLIIAANRWKSASAGILTVLKSDSCKKFSLVPLYINSDIEDTELRICLQAEDPDRLGEFLARKIRKVKGVIASRVRLTLSGEIFPDGVCAVARMRGRQVTGHVFLNTSPGEDGRVWGALRKLKKHHGVLPVWIFRDFYDYGRDITLRLIGEKEKGIREYVDRFLGDMHGVVSWKLRFTHSSVKLLGEKELLALARNWFSKPVVKQK